MPAPDLHSGKRPAKERPLLHRQNLSSLGQALQAKTSAIATIGKIDINMIIFINHAIMEAIICKTCPLTKARSQNSKITLITWRQKYNASLLELDNNIHPHNSADPETNQPTRETNPFCLACGQQHKNQNSLLYKIK